MLNPMDLEIHPTKSDLKVGMWVFHCDDCSFEANYSPMLERFEIIVVGDPFARHVCHHNENNANIRDLINELDLKVEEMEVEF